jgi:DNA-binding NarL/FixJ family response regulator
VELHTRDNVEPEFDVIGIVTGGRALVHAAIELKPDGAILEIFLPQLNGLDAAGKINREVPKLKLLFITANDDPEAAAEAFRRGASAHVLKHSGADELLKAIRTAMRGETYLSSLLAHKTIEYLLYPPKRGSLKKHITSRQAEILQLLTEGRT